jgi:micrococcal nuclease
MKPSRDIFSDLYRDQGRSPIRPPHGHLSRRLAGRWSSAICTVGLLWQVGYPPETSAQEAVGRYKNTAIATASGCGAGDELHQVTGVVVSVHDGDSVTITQQAKRVPVRLKGIDAPESSQPFGLEARQTLAGLVLNRPVTVSYSKTDQYGRLIGRVYTAECIDVSLHQITAGMAWFYSAFECELPKNIRAQFKTSHEKARGAGIGLWAQKEPEPPWVYRNGKSPAVPTCAD